MEKFLTSYLFLILSVVAVVVIVVLIIRLRDIGRLSIFAADTLVMVSCLSVCTKSIYIPLLELCVLTVPFLYSTSSWIKRKNDMLLPAMSVILGVLFIMYNLLCSFGVLAPFRGLHYAVATVCVAQLCILFHLLSVWRCVKDIGFLMNRGNAWQLALAGTDSVYVMSLQLPALMAVMSFLCPPVPGLFMCCAAVVLVFMMHLALNMRHCHDAAFVFMRSHERIILASLKDESLPDSDGSGPDEDVYKAIYERILKCFYEKKPYLSGALTINDIVEEVFTNKFYVSKAISLYSGRNFCQFVNHFRIMHSIECFRENPDLKVSELWPLCGFNSIVSFNMAFRLFMNENPSEWCRKEKIRLSDKKK